MKLTKLFTLIILSIIFNCMYAANNDKNEASESELQSTAIHGIIKDAISGEVLTGVAIKLEGDNKTYFTDFDGKYFINNIKAGEYSVTYTYISYQTEKEENIEIKEKESKEINLTMYIIK